MRESRVEPQRPVPTMKRSFGGLTPAPWYPGARPLRNRRSAPLGRARRPPPRSRRSAARVRRGLARSCWRRSRGPSSSCSGPGVPAAPRDRAEGFRHLLRFLAAGHLLCVEHADPDHPSFARMVDPAWQWGLDMPDCLYLYAPLRGDAAYRVWGRRGSREPRRLPGELGALRARATSRSWGTLSSASTEQLDVGVDGSLELWLGGPPRPRNWLPVAPNAEFLLVRQYFADWESELPGGPLDRARRRRRARPPPRADQIAARLERGSSAWLDRGGALWERMSRGFVEGIAPNTLMVTKPADSDQRAGLRGQAYGIGNFHCAPEEAVLGPIRAAALSSLERVARELVVGEHGLRGAPDVAQRRIRPGSMRTASSAASSRTPTRACPTGSTPRATSAARWRCASCSPMRARASSSSGCRSHASPLGLPDDDAADLRSRARGEPRAAAPRRAAPLSALGLPMARITCEIEDGVAIVRLDDGKVNAIDARLVRGARRRARRASSAIAAPRRVVLFGRPGCFCAGLDRNACRRFPPRPCARRRGRSSPRWSASSCSRSP